MTWFSRAHQGKRHPYREAGRRSSAAPARRGSSRAGLDRAKAGYQRAMPGSVDEHSVRSRAGHGRTGLRRDRTRLRFAAALFAALAAIVALQPFVSPIPAIVIPIVGVLISLACVIAAAHVN